MVLDVRASVISDVGPVISGSFRDDHIQGQGLVTTSGEIVIAGLVTPATGSSVNLGYVTADGGRAARFPRGPFKVVQAFANPLTRQTTIKLADSLAYHKGQGGGVLNSNVTEALNNREPATNPSVNLRDTAALICERIGVTVGSLGNWTLRKQVPELRADDYVDTLSDILASAGHVGYLDPENKLQAVKYSELSDAGPVITFADIIDLDMTAGGLNYSENPTSTGNAQVVEQPDPEDDNKGEGSLVSSDSSQGSDPLVNETYGGYYFQDSLISSTTRTEGSIVISTKNGSREYSTVEEVTSTDRVMEPDNRVISRSQTTRNPLVKLNSQVVQDHLDASLGFSRANEMHEAKVEERYTYIEAKGQHSGQWTKEERERFDQEIEAAKANFTASGGLGALEVLLLPELPTYRLVRQEATRTLPYVEALGRVGIQDYSLLPAVPSSGAGVESKVITEYRYFGDKMKQITRRYVAYGLTQMGQQSIASFAAKAEEIDSYDDILKHFFKLVLDDVNTNVSSIGQPQPKLDMHTLSNVTTKDVVIQGSTQIQVAGSTSVLANNNEAFDMSFVPDDILLDDGSITPSGVASDESREEALNRYAEEQNQQLLGHRQGMQIVTGLDKFPNKPLAAFHVQANGQSATYRVNGTSWAFDSNSCLVSTDALYWGMAGGSVSGSLWTPLAPGVTSLPTAPSTTTNSSNNSSTNPVNSVTLSTPLDVSNQTAVDAILASLPDDETQTHVDTIDPTQISKPYKATVDIPGIIRLGGDVLIRPFGFSQPTRVIDSAMRIGPLSEFLPDIVADGIHTDPVTGVVKVAFDMSEGVVTTYPRFDSGLTLGSTLGMVITVGDTTDYPLHGSTSFYANQAALEADGFTYVGDSADADDEMLTFTPSSSFQNIQMLGGAVPNTPTHAWGINTNGGVFYDTDEDIELAAFGTMQSVIADAREDIGNVAADLYVGWFSQDTLVSLAGYKEINDGTRDWLVVRVDMTIPWDGNGGCIIEAWFATDGSISVRYGDTFGGASLTVGSDRNGIVSNSSTIAELSPHTANFQGLTSTGDYVINFLMAP